jgi:hypothetical protein
MSHCGEKIALRVNLRYRKPQIGMVVWEMSCALSLGTRGRKMGESGRAEPAIEKGYRTTLYSTSRGPMRCLRSVVRFLSHKQQTNAYYGSAVGAQHAELLVICQAAWAS